MPTFDSTDFDNASSESGVVHESVANTDHNDASVLKQGYSIADPYLSADLVGYWPLHEDSGGTAYDFSGSNNDGTVNGATQGATGLLGTTAYSFDGTDDYVDTGYNGAAFYNNQWAFSAWIKWTTTDSENFAGVRDSSAIPSLQFRIGHAGGTNTTSAGDLACLFRDNNSNYLVWGTSGESFNDGNWHHVVFIANDLPNENVTLFVDGVENSSISSNESPSFTSGSFSSNFALGGALESGSINSPADVDIAEVRIYDHALTQSEIQYLYDVVAAPGTLQTQFKSV